MKQKKSLGITVEIVLLNISFILLFAIVIILGSSRAFRKVIRQQMETRIGDICFVARECVDGNLMQEYSGTEGKSEKALHSLKLLQTVCDSTKFNYLYLIQVDLEKQKVINLLSVHGSMYPELKVYGCGQISDITSDEYRIAYKQILNGEKKSAFVYRIVPDSSFYRHHITGLAPVYNSDNQITGIICAEATMAWYKEALQYYMTYFLALIVAMIVIVIFANNLLLEHRIIIPFLKIKKETERFAQFTSLNEETLFGSVNRKNELGQLAQSIDSMENKTLEYISNIEKMAAEKESNKVQLKIATEIQTGALPKPITIEGVDLYATMKPALEVGGDFYDFFMIDDKHLGLVVADVSGKGIPASLFMMVSKIILSKNLKSGMSPAEALNKTNMELCETNPAEMFVTCLCGILNTETFELVLANAGHEKPAIFRNGNSFVLEETKPCFVLGGMSGVKYKDQVIQLSSGDILFMYTDGIPEAINSENEEFGNDRMLEVLNSAKNDTLENLCSRMQKAISDYNGDVPQFDDITMLTIKIVKKV